MVGPMTKWAARLCALATMLAVWLGVHPARAATLFTQTPVLNDAGQSTNGGIIRADNFTIPGGQGWAIDLVRTRFTFVTASPDSAATARVRFFSDAGGLPGTEVCDRPGVVTNQAGPVKFPAYADWTLNLSSPCVLGSGNYWISISGETSVASMWATNNSTGGLAVSDFTGPPWVGLVTSTAYVVIEGTTLATTTTALGASANPLVFGQSVVLTATVTSGAGTPTGSVSFFDGASPLGTASLTDGVATLTVPNLGALGGHSLTASYAGNPSFQPSTSSALGENVNQANSTTSLTSSPTAAPYGQAFSLNATVAAAAPGGGVPTGTVTFFEGPTNLGSAPLNGSGVASISPTGMQFGDHSYTATYSGSANHAASASGTHVHQVWSAPVTVTATANPDPAVCNQPVEFLIKTTSIGGIPNGTVAIWDQYGERASAALAADGTATVKLTDLYVKDWKLLAEYYGDSPVNNFNYGESEVTVSVTKANETIALSSSANPVIAGSPVTLTATTAAVAPSTGTPIGSVTFYDGGQELGTGSLDKGIAKLTVTLPLGTHTLRAEHNNDTFCFNPANSPNLTQQVNQSGVTVALASSGSPSVYRTGVTFTATVTVVGTPGAATPTGTVTFKEGAASLGTGSVDAQGKATFTTSSLGGGNHTITAEYGGDTSYTGGSSSSLVQTVDPAPTTTTLTATPTSGPPGASITLAAHVASSAAGGAAISGTVTFKDDKVTLGSKDLAAGSTDVSITVTTLPLGTHSITAEFGGDDNYAASVSAASSVAITPIGTSDAGVPTDAGTDAAVPTDPTKPTGPTSPNPGPTSSSDAGASSSSGGTTDGGGDGGCQTTAAGSAPTTAAGLALGLALLAMARRRRKR